MPFPVWKHAPTSVFPLKDEKDTSGDTEFTVMRVRDRQHLWKNTTGKASFIGKHFLKGVRTKYKSNTRQNKDIKKTGTNVK